MYDYNLVILVQYWLKVSLSTVPSLLDYNFALCSFFFQIYTWDYHGSGSRSLTMICKLCILNILKGFRPNTIIFGVMQRKPPDFIFLMYTLKCLSSAQFG